jgi:putative sterol carrier protein
VRARREPYGRAMTTTKLFDYGSAADLRSDLEQLWATLDRLFATVPQDRWTRRYGPDWTYADVAYHIAYFDRVMVADVIEAGTALPQSERWEALSMRELNDWNRAEFAKRRPGQTPGESIDEMLRQRERIGRCMADLSDADLERPAFSHFFGLGFSTLGSALAGARQHAFSEGWELAYRLGRVEEIRIPERVQHEGVDAYVRLMVSMLDREAATKIGRFTMVFDMPGYAGGAWTIGVAGGAATVTPERAKSADLVMTLSTDTFMTMFKKIRNPMLLMLSGKIRVRGFSKMGQFGKLFPEPKLDAPLTLEAARAAA